jgi:O-antigen ligase
MSFCLPLLKLRLLPTQIGILICFVLMTGWFRLPPLPAPLPSLYVARFTLLAAMLLTVIIWLCSGLPGIRRLGAQPLRAGGALLLLCLALWAYASQSWAFMAARQPEAGANAALVWCVLALFVVVTASACPSPRILTGVLIGALALQAGIVIAQSLAGGALGLRPLGEFPFDAARAGTSILQAGDLTYVRPYGLYPHPNILAGALMLGGLLAGAFALRAAPLLHRLPALLLSGLLVAALLLTFSRAAWLGMAAGGVSLLLLVRPRWRALLHAALLALLIGGIFVALYRPLLGARVGEGTESVELRSVADRVVFTDFALRAIGERPLVGQGVGNFPWRAADYLRETFFDLRGDHVHHVYLSVWAEMGLVGFVLFSIAQAAGIAAALHRTRQPTAAHDALARAGLLAVVTGLMVVGLLDHYPYSQLPLMALWWGSLVAAAA